MIAVTRGCAPSPAAPTRSRPPGSPATAARRSCGASRSAGGILAGNQLARWFAVAVLGLNAIDMMFFLPAYPFWALVIIAVDVVALYGLCAYGSRQYLEAA